MAMLRAFAALFFVSTVGLAAAPSPAPSPSPAPTPAPTPVPHPPPPSLGPIDRGATAAALGAVNVQSCREPKRRGSTGSGHFTITFEPSGHVQAGSVVIDSGPFVAPSPTGACVVALYSAVTIPPFSGEPVKIGHAFTIQ